MENNEELNVVKNEKTNWLGVIVLILSVALGVLGVFLFDNSLYISYSSFQYGVVTYYEPGNYQKNGFIKVMEYRKNKNGEIKTKNVKHVVDEYIINEISIGDTLRRNIK
jgi:hypothetical protein